MRRILAFTALLLFFWTFSNAQTVRKYSNEFLKIGVGARAHGMGNAMTAIADDATAGFWNPAGLNFSYKSPQIAAMHSEYFAGVAKYDYIGFTMPIDDDRRFGASVIRLGVDDIANTLNLIDQNGNIDFNAVEKFSVADLAVVLSFAQRLKILNGLNVGANVKVVNRSVGEFGNAWGFGIDAGAIYENGPLRVGLMLADLSNTFNAWTFNTENFEDVFVQTGNIVPENSLEITLPSTRIGVGYKFFEARKVNLLVSLDTDLHYDGKRNVLANIGGMSIDPHAGIELSYKDFLFIRGGYKNLQQVPNDQNEMVYSVFPSVGAGFVFKNISVDYALSNVGNFSQVLYSHVFSLKYDFRKKQ